MAIGIVILAHEHLPRTRQLARYLASKDCKIVIHVDAKTPLNEFNTLKSRLKRNPNICFAPRIACGWGGFSLVKAGMASAQIALETWPNISHVVQISGACLPTRPIEELVSFLSVRKGEDFVECTSQSDGGWIKDGLREERLSLYFPFSWKRQRWLFDRFVDLQRAMGVNRKMPTGLDPHFGSQWWCLSTQTLRAILDDPDRSRFEKYFRWCWIPDESYIPTLVHRHAKRLNRQSLTLSRFDAQGKPYIFYDDHAPMLEQTDQFFVRKVWEGASGLYKRFLQQTRPPLDRPISADLGIDVMLREAETLRCDGRKGRLHPGRFPCEGHAPKPETCRPYSVFVGFQHVFQGFDSWLESTTGALAHGRIFQRSKVAFAHGLTDVVAGAIAANTKTRNVNPEQFLANVLWSQRDRHQTMFYELSDGRRMAEFLIEDENADLFILRGSWVLDLFHRRPVSKKMFLRQAHRLQQLEDAMLTKVTAESSANVTILSLADMIADTPRLLRYIQDCVRPGLDLHPAVFLQLRDLSALHSFVAFLDQNGIDVSGLRKLPDYLPGDALWGNPERILASA